MHAHKAEVQLEFMLIQQHFVYLTHIGLVRRQIIKNCVLSAYNYTDLSYAGNYLLLLL
jgi:hypothetical protein